jgi:hypothetical protein
VSSDFAEALGLIDWPFGIVPDPEVTLVWADRHELLHQINRMLRRLTGTRESSLHVLWADFGAGKTHTLLYLRQLALAKNGRLVYPVYVALPKDARSFSDLYRAIVSSITVGKLMEVYSGLPKDNQVFTGTNPFMGEWLGVLSRVFKILNMGSDTMKQTAQKWILGDKSLGRQELVSASLPDKIRDDDGAINTLSGMARLLISCHFRLLIMIDEFQRAGLLRREFQNKIQAGLHSFLNNCPKGISIILSFKFGSAREIQSYLSPELMDRADPEIIEIPTLKPEEAEEFLKDLVEAVRSPNNQPRIDSDAIAPIVHCVSSVGTTKPRTLTKTAGLILSQGAMDIIDGAIKMIDKRYVDRKCKELQEVITRISAEGEEESD